MCTYSLHTLAIFSKAEKVRQLPRPALLYCADYKRYVNGKFSFQGLNLVYGGELLRVCFGHYSEFTFRWRKQFLWEDRTYSPGLLDYAF
jgi:hypothetical protein